MKRFLAAILVTLVTESAFAATGTPTGGGMAAADIDTSAELRAILTDEVGTGGAYFVGGALGTPSSGTGTNITGIPPANVTGTAAILGANTFTAMQTITQASANAGILASTGYSLTGSNATNMIDVAGTWNTSGTPTALKVNITNTASNSLSKLFDFQAGGTSQISGLIDGRVASSGFSAGNSFGIEFFTSLANAVARTISGRVAGFSSNTGGGVGGIAWASDFKLRWGVNSSGSGSDGMNSPDTAVSKATPGVVGIEGASAVGGTQQFVPLSPSQITSNQDNYNPGGRSKYLRLSTDASRDITGLTFATTQVTGEEHVIVNVGAQNIVLKHDVTSTAANRFSNSTAADITLSGGQAADIWYDGTSSRWRVYKRN